MIARAILFLFFFFAAFFALYWAAFRMRYFTAGRVFEIGKTAGIAILAAASTTIAFGIVYFIK